MSCGSKKRMGFQGALLAAGLMLGTASTALASSPDNSREREKRVEVQKKIEKHKTVEVTKRSSSSGAHDGRGGSGHAGWNNGDSRRRYEPPRWYAPRPASSRPRYDDHGRHGWGTGGSGHGHGHAYGKKYEPPRRPSHGPHSRAKYEAKKERLEDKYEAKKERLQDKYEDKKRR